MNNEKFQARVKGQPKGLLYDCVMMNETMVRITDPDGSRVRFIDWFNKRYDRVAVVAPATEAAPTPSTSTPTI